MASAQRKPNLGWSPPRSPCPGPLVLMSWGCMDSNAWLNDGSYPWVVCMRRWERPCTIHGHDRSTDGTRHGTRYLRRRPSTAKCVLLPLLEFHARFMTDLRDCRGRPSHNTHSANSAKSPRQPIQTFATFLIPKSWLQFHDNRQHRLGMQRCENPARRLDRSARYVGPMPVMPGSYV